MTAPDRRLLAVMLIFVAIIATHLDVVPFWDAQNYLHCVEEAVDKPFDLLNFRCYGHPSFIGTWLWGATQYLWPWTPAAMYIVNAIVGLASIAAFDAIARLLFPSRRGVEYTLVTALYALAPLFVAHAVFLNLDYGATAFFVILLYGLLARRYWIAAASAVAALFTKETGGAACAIAAAVYVCVIVVRPQTSWRERLRDLGPLAPLLAAPLVVAAYFVLVLVRREPDVLNAFAPTQAIASPRDLILNINPADPGIRAFLTDIFVLNFQWLFTVTIVLALCLAPKRALSRRGVFLGVVLIGLVYMTTRYQSHNAVRYVLLDMPVLVLTFYHALDSLRVSARARILSLVACTAVVFVSNFTTIDFVSRLIFGTFRFGAHRLLATTSFSGGLPYDSIVYNLEFTELQYLYGDMMRDLRPTGGTVFLTGNVLYNFPPDVDARTYGLTAHPSPYAVPLFINIGDITPGDLASHLPDSTARFYYVAFANADNEQLDRTKRQYPLIARKRYERRGYTLDLYTFQFSLGR